MSGKLREALEGVESILSTWLDHLPPVVQDKAREAIEKSEKALAEPVMNCEVGTAKEQVERHKKWCNGNVCLFTHSCRICFANWSQKPYNEEVK
jgi:hypothetical protein